MTGIYFSGTGNTKFCISHFLTGIEGEHRLLSIEDSAAVSEISGAEEMLFAYPVYYSSLPKIVSDFILNNQDFPGNKCTMCYRCFSLCQQKAITIIGKDVIVQYNFNDYSGKE